MQVLRFVNRESFGPPVHFHPPENARKCRRAVYVLPMEKTVQRFATFAEAEKTDREFYKKLTGNERLQILLELLKHAPEQRLERVHRITKLSPR